jgi:2-polyprenyl-3-methyl-5-hydroxy-6-metoxy-1,4-benzoquinol methylase
MMANPKMLVALGYDKIAEAYFRRFGQSEVRDRWLAELFLRLPPKARILDLGCGAGIPVARELVDGGFDLVGVDGSARQIKLACVNVPEAEFIHADMTDVDFDRTSFDAVIAFYSITHVPRREHGMLLRRIAGWLKPSGVFFASLGARECDDWSGEWLGTKMYFSHYDADENKRLIRDAGFSIEHAEVVTQDNENARFLWVVARLGHREN